MTAINLCLIFMFAALTGCAHPIVVAPKEEAITRTPEMPDQIQKKVGFYISPESLNLEVTTPGGGGDNVRYFPYRDMEAGFRKMLSNVFSGVVRVAKMNDPVEFERGGLTYIISPEVVTSSGSTGFFTWPPTNFTVDLTIRIRDLAGKILGSPRAIGVGSAGGVIEMNGNFGLTGQLAMQDALQKSHALLFDLFDKNIGDSVHSSRNPGSILEKKDHEPTKDRLIKLKGLLDERLISPEEYDRKRNEILNKM